MLATHPINWNLSVSQSARVLRPVSRTRYGHRIHRVLFVVEDDTVMGKAVILPRYYCEDGDNFKLIPWGR